MTFTDWLGFGFGAAVLVTVGWLIGTWVHSASRRHQPRWFDLYDVFDEEDRDAIG